jgi:AcrR family transcriptional regulator
VREKEETRQRIIDAARGLFVEHGYDAVSMRKIADAIEYSPAAVYQHFDDKLDLMRVIVAEDFEKLAGEFSRLAAVKDPVERIRQIGMSYIRFAVSYPQHFRMMFMNPPPVEPLPEKMAHREDPTRNAYAFLKAAVAEAVATGRMRPKYKNVELTSQVCWATAHGVAALLVTMRCDEFIPWAENETLSGATIDAALRGMTLEKGGR